MLNKFITCHYQKSFKKCQKCNFGLKIWPIGGLFITETYKIISLTNTVNLFHKFYIGWWSKKNVLYTDSYGYNRQIVYVIKPFTGRAPYVHNKIASTRRQGQGASSNHPPKDKWTWMMLCLATKWSHSST